MKGLPEPTAYRHLGSHQIISGGRGKATFLKIRSMRILAAYATIPLQKRVATVIF